MEALGVLGISLGSLAMSLGIIGFVFGLRAFIQTQKLTKTLKEKGVLDEDNQEEQ